MFEIEYGAEYSDSHVIRFKPENWDKRMATISANLAEFVSRNLISEDDFEKGMEWITGVVVDDIGVRVPARFGDLSLAITRED